MGFVRINIPNPYGVYMHDTPVQGHLRRRFPLRLVGLRARAERPRLHRMAPQGHARLEPRADRRRLQGGRAHRRAPAQPVPIYWVYITAWATPDGLVQFRDDIYNKDGLGNAVPVASRVPTAAGRGDVPAELRACKRPLPTSSGLVPVISFGGAAPPRAGGGGGSAPL